MKHDAAAAAKSRQELSAMWRERQMSILTDSMQPHGQVQHQRMAKFPEIAGLCFAHARRRRRRRSDFGSIFYTDFCFVFENDMGEWLP